MKPIDGEQLEEIIYKYYCKSCREKRLDRCRGCKVTNILGFMKKLCGKVEVKPEWIPVEDHLPKIDEVVIVQDLFEGIFIGKIYDPTKHNGKYGSYFINIQNHCVQTGVAWMPKPTPYKAGDLIG